MHVDRTTPYPFPAELVLSPISRHPLRLPEATIAAILANPIPVAPTALINPHTDGPPVVRASIVIVTFNNLAYTKLCLESLVATTADPAYEIIVVDNGSTDGTPDYLEALQRQWPHIRALRSDTNLGFARANNRGLALATGDVLVLLNNDTVPPPGWLTRLVRHLNDPAIGAVGPVTNRICNEAEIDVPYRTYGELFEFAETYTRAHAGELFDIRMLAMFCLAMRRDVYAQVGPLDEQFEVGMLEDDDYSMRVRAAGYRVVCAEDVFVHHFSKATFGELVATGVYSTLIEANRRRWEEKWGIRWEPYQRRPRPEYQALTDRVRAIVRSAVRPGATVIVVSKGDGDLLQLDGRPAWHFPQADDGTYAGYYPADSAAAIAHLEALRTKGGDILLFPGTAFWWLDHYVELQTHLDAHYRRIWADPDCIIYQLDSHVVVDPEAP